MDNPGPPGGLRPVNASSLFRALFNKGLFSLPCLVALQSVVVGGSGSFCKAFIWWLNGWFPHDFFCSHLSSNCPVQRERLDECGCWKGLRNRFHRLQNGHAGTSSLPVGFTLKARLFLNILLGLYNRKSIYRY